MVSLKELMIANIGTIRQLLGQHYADLYSRDVKRGNQPRRNRHRLFVHIREIEDYLKNGGDLDVVAAAEISLAAHYFSVHAKGESWDRFVKAIRDSGQFPHALATLAASAHLRAKLIEEDGSQKLPDLLVDDGAIRFRAEVKCKGVLTLPNPNLDEAKAFGLVEDAMRSAKHQLSEMDGVLIMPTFHLGDADIALLRQAAEAYFMRRAQDGHTKPRLIGVVFVHLRIILTGFTLVDGKLTSDDSGTFKPGSTVELVRNPYYEGAIKLDDGQQNNAGEQLTEFNPGGDW